MSDSTSPLRLHDKLPWALDLAQVELALRSGVRRRLRDSELRETLLVCWLTSLHPYCLRDTKESRAIVAGLRELAPGVEIPLDLSFLREHLSLSNSSLDAARRRLRESGVWEEIEGSATLRVRFAEEVLEQSASAASSVESLRWDRILAALKGDAGALSLVRSYLHLMRGSAEWHALSHAQVGSRMLAGRDAIRRARNELLRTGLLEERNIPGQPNEVRWSAYARGLSAISPSQKRVSPVPDAPAVPSSSEQKSSQVAFPASALPSHPSLPSSSLFLAGSDENKGSAGSPEAEVPAVFALPRGIPVSLSNGEVLRVPSAMQAHLELKETGQYYLHIGPLVLGPLPS